MAICVTMVSMSRSARLRQYGGPMACEVEVRHSFSAPASLVWRGLTSADALRRWFWPEQSYGTSAETDLRVGGRYLIAGPRAGIAVSGRYTLIEPCQRLGFTWQWDGEADASEVVIELTDTEMGTDIVVTHAGLPDEAAAENHSKGWSDCLARLPMWLASADA